MIFTDIESPSIEDHFLYVNVLKRTKKEITFDFLQYALPHVPWVVSQGVRIDGN